jgi:hypothetical protein
MFTRSGTAALDPTVPASTIPYQVMLLKLLALIGDSLPKASGLGGFFLA